MEETINNPHELSFNLGRTVAERLDYVTKIKDAMAQAIMMQVEMARIDAADESFIIYQTIYLEANDLEIRLRKL